MWTGDRIHPGFVLFLFVLDVCFGFAYIVWRTQEPFFLSESLLTRKIDRLYLASYDSPPNSRTPFPYALEQPKSPSKRSAASSPGRKRSPVYFTVDDTLLYNAFHADFGPLHIGHLYRFAVHFHEILGDPENSDRPVVFYSRPDARSRANAACLVASYMVLIQSWPPHLALAPIAQADPPYMPFRDAGYSQADFILTIQDVVYGVWRAKEQSLCGLRDFSLEEYVLRKINCNQYTDNA